MNWGGGLGVTGEKRSLVKDEQNRRREMSPGIET